MRGLVGSLAGLAILDGDDRARRDGEAGSFRIAHWRRYEIENYFVTPELLRRYALERYPSNDLLADETRTRIDEALNAVVLERVFDDDEADFRTWRDAAPDAARLIWLTKTERRKLSALAEDFFRRLGVALGQRMLLRKGELHRLVAFVPPESLPAEVGKKNWTCSLRCSRPRGRRRRSPRTPTERRASRASSTAPFSSSATYRFSARNSSTTLRPGTAA